MISIISVTEKGDEIAYKLKENFDSDIYLKSKLKDFKLDNITKECFKKYKVIVFLSSTGIAVRAISKYLKGKDVDPAVIVVDVCNNFTISLVSGHLGGANKLTYEISNVLGNIPVITTATDNMDLIAPDILAKNNNLIIEDLKKAKVIAGRLVNKETVYFKDDENKIDCPKGYIETEEVKDNTVWITNSLKEQENVLKLIRKNIILGIGCRKDTDSKKLSDFVSNVLLENYLDKRSVKLIASIDVKKNEKAILDLAKELNSKLKFYTKEEIMTVEEKYEGSAFVKATVGVSSVSEPVVDLSGGEIIIEKIKNNGMTLTVGIEK
ncbi:cobalamin biosynthesis protein CbiG [Clostridium baratii]|uniref:cobalt-precorrin 5A hydrolase n=1 Tax=Clostridium baratii TaxID=1561 RepID=UPI0009A3CA6E|nr:cobalt-precorrin 5A hydrolase [Clostridium baratii]OPF50324.1 cobalamin biosynthesis protein CbiG [Clostridium baratii]OPF53268.1 cobalamin biosynthesis protein CbiG [Clostridium baratii]OPF54783.1 cobalamin biosynthesis protein CbiG [Clostridium baratii]OPF61239.1 cobalamin biosynthesis protein CbiG [Clostridium baratii]